MRTQRQVVDYSLQRRALLRDVYAGRVGTYEVCDASPYLLSAARFHGEATDERCPICRRENLTRVNYIYGDELKQSAGQARSSAELPMLAMTLREFQVYVVEVCRGCTWNHLIEQFMLVTEGIKGPLGEVYHAIEAPKGELGFYIRSTGGKSPYRLHVRAPSFVSLQAIEKMAIGGLVSDLIAIIASLDPVMGEVDR